MSLAACMPSSFRFFSICLLRARLARSSALMAQPMMRECRGGRSSLLEWQPGHHGLTPCSQSVTLSHWGLSVLTVDSRDSHSALTANTRWRALAAASSALAGDCRGWAQTAHTADCVTPCLTPSQLPGFPLDLVDTGHLQWYLLRESDWQCVVSSHVSSQSQLPLTLSAFLWPGQYTRRGGGWRFNVQIIITDWTGSSWRSHTSWRGQSLNVLHLRHTGPDLLLAVGYPAPHLSLSLSHRFCWLHQSQARVFTPEQSLTL